MALFEHSLWMSLAVAALVTASGAALLSLALEVLLRALGAFPHGFIAPLARAWLSSMNEGPDKKGD